VKEDATGSIREEALRRALAAHREAYKQTVETIEADLAAGRMTFAQARGATRAAQAAYDRAVAAAEGGQS
jgi:hypothetical protein